VFPDGFSTVAATQAIKTRMDIRKMKATCRCVRDEMFGVEEDCLVEIGDRLIVLVDPTVSDVSVRHR
jgi:hypothetical protein